MCQPYSVAASPDGFIYVVDMGSSWYFNIHNCIHKFDREGFLDSGLIVILVQVLAWINLQALLLVEMGLFM